MKRIIPRWLFVCFVCILGLSLTIFTILSALEFKRISELCRNSTSVVNNSHEAINALRNYRGSWVLTNSLSALNRSDLFKSDGFGSNGGWRVQEFTALLFIREYDVTFEVFRPQFEISCNVYACGAVDSCRTLGRFID